MIQVYDGDGVSSQEPRYRVWARINGLQERWLNHCQIMPDTPYSWHMTADETDALTLTDADRLAEIVRTGCSNGTQQVEVRLVQVDEPIERWAVCLSSMLPSMSTPVWFNGYTGNSMPGWTRNAPVLLMSQADADHLAEQLTAIGFKSLARRVS